MRVLDTEDAARHATRAGVRRLFMIEYSEILEYQVKHLPDLATMTQQFKSLGTPAELRGELMTGIADRLILGDRPDVHTQMEYELRLQAAWNRLGPAVQEVSAIAAQILPVYQDLAIQLSATLPPLLQDSIADMRNQLARLVPEDFLTATPAIWLKELPRYLRGIDVRLKKLLNAGLPRDAQNTADLRPLWQAYLKRASEHRAHDIHDPELLRFRWDAGRTAHLPVRPGTKDGRASLASTDDPTVEPDRRAVNPPSTHSS